MKILVISHNEYLQNIFYKIESKHDLTLMTDENVDWDSIDDSYDVIWSFHCKKIFPKHIIQKFKCINIHPGFNPDNRGHAPQVFSILNGKRCGVTIHHIDEKIDHGYIIYQEEVDVHPWYTSLDVYNRIIEKEEELLIERFDEFTESPNAIMVESQGNINYRKDFNRMCKLDLSSVGTIGEHINLLRALTHGDFNNAYFVVDGKKVFVKISLEKEDG